MTDRGEGGPSEAELEHAEQEAHQNLDAVDPNAELHDNNDGGNPTAAPEAPPTDEETPPIGTPEDPNASRERRRQTVDQLFNDQVVDEEHIDHLARLDEDRLRVVDQLLRDEVFRKDDIEMLAKLPKEDLQAYQSRELIVQQLVRDGHFTEDDAAQLRQLDVDELQEWLAEFQEGTIDAEHPSDTELPSVDKITRDEVFADIDEEVAKQELKWLGKDGIIESHVKQQIRAEVTQELDAELDGEAKAAFQDMSPEDKQRHKLDDLDEEEFIEAYRAQRLMDPEYQEERAARMKQAVQERADQIMGRLKDKPTPEALDEVLGKEPGRLDWIKGYLIEYMQTLPDAAKEFLKEQIRLAGKDTAEAMLDVDFTTFMRFLVNVDASSQLTRDGRASYEDGKFVRLIGKEDFDARIQKPQEFGMALAKMYNESTQLQEAGFRLDDKAILEAAAKGDAGAIRAVMEQFLKHLFEFGEEGPDANERWKAARQALPEAMFPGVNARLDDEMKKHLKLIKDSVGQRGGMFEVLFPEKSAQTQSQDIQSSTPAPTSEPAADQSEEQLKAA